MIRCQEWTATAPVWVVRPTEPEEQSWPLAPGTVAPASEMTVSQQKPQGLRTQPTVSVQLSSSRQEERQVWLPATPLLRPVSVERQVLVEPGVPA